MNITSQIYSISEDILTKCNAKISKSFKLFIEETLFLYLAMGKANFTQLGRYGSWNEKTYRRNFEDCKMNWFQFNLELAKQYFDGSKGIKAIAIDPSYISKSGKHTPFTGYFWSGSASAAKWGLEILGMGIIDSVRHECIMLGACQTPDAGTLSNEAICKDGKPAEYLVGSEAVTDMDHVRNYIKETKVTRPYHKKSVAAKIKAENPDETTNRFTLIDWYLHALGTLGKEVFEYARIVVADAYFAKRNFADGLARMGLGLVSRLRDDAALWYIYSGPQTGKKGRPKMFDGKVDINNLDMNVFQEMEYTFEGGRCFTATVYSKSLKSKIKVVVWFSKDGSRHKIFFSNDLTLEPEDIVMIYRTRFQIEFEFRDGKGHVSLNCCQARSTNKLRTHFNMSFTALNCLKMAARKEGVPYSISNLKTMAHGQYLMKRFISVSGISPDSDLIKKLYQEILSLTSMTERPAA